jgi:hypothetical protein
MGFSNNDITISELSEVTDHDCKLHKIGIVHSNNTFMKFVIN